LLIVMAMSVANAVKLGMGPPLVHAIQVLFGVGIWSLLLWKVWRKPISWGWGVGVFLILMLIFQIWLWHLAVSAPRPERLGSCRNPFVFALYEVPLMVAIISCIRLRRCCQG
jgi:hypothetical protein